MTSVRTPVQPYSRTAVQPSLARWLAAEWMAPLHGSLWLLFCLFGLAGWLAGWLPAWVAGGWLAGCGCGWLRYLLLVAELSAS